MYVKNKFHLTITCHKYCTKEKKSTSIHIIKYNGKDNKFDDSQQNN